MTEDDAPDNFNWSKLFDVEATVVTRPKASVSFMITRAQKQRLRELGYSEEAITNMPPEEAHELLRRGEAAP